MRIALGQEPRQRAEPGEPRERERAFHQAARPQAQRFDGEGAEMLVEPRPPDEAKGVARLQRRVEPRRSSAAHKTQMPAVRACHRLDDRGLFAVPANANDKAFVAPFHPSPLP